MFSAYIFSGPTLPEYLITEKLGYVVTDDHQLKLMGGGVIKFLPPVAEGDVLKLVEKRPMVIGIIDGYFETMPSVWHKEILYAMSKGIHVLGSSSMGALRAAELKAFGMEGVGAIYNAFADGILEDDDEVTVVHGPEEIGFPLLSEAMVNIRRTLDDACVMRVITFSQKQILLDIAKKLHYKKRTYVNMLANAKEYSIDQACLKRFCKWLEGGRQDQKMLDALALVQNVINKISTATQPKKVIYNFENTLIWEHSRTNHSEV